MSLNFLDWILLFILVVSVVTSAMKGFVRELMGIASLVAAFILGSWFYRDVSTLFKEVVKNENIALFLGFALSFWERFSGARCLGGSKLIKFAKISGSIGC
jgi:membrane protein required for colicin V production